ncbi:TonB-dependent receptor [Flavobacterium jejuense]|uniref:TonB-dependent receptor n=1 Tax=Flavobacterium jejuense TaxID=1544455 RepID=A0ABX0IPG3_9FLAO|nr:TonB-dependent receptor [Flavobacterium jejuense]NHN25697.1 TonB-dependent receptor [Flavobacterium jejuense]
MKKLTYYSLIFFLILNLFQGYSQTKFKGAVKDDKEKLSLFGALVSIKADGTTAVDQVSVDFDGTFKVTTTKTFGTVEISMNGFITKSIPFYGKGDESTVDLGVIYLEENSVTERDIIVTTSSIDVIKDRKTPISSSTMRNYEMREKASNKDFIELTSQMPGVYTSRVGGGYGDTRMNVRGFEQNNISPMIDGIPVYDLEAGIVDWANIASMNDVASSIQLQRGLGASKLVNSSVAGTMNMILRDANYDKGGFLYNSVGNDGYKKFVGSFATGLLQSGFSANILLSSTSGDGYVNSTNFEAYSYYIALGFKKKKHDFQFKVFGSPQWHNQRVSDIALSTYIERGNGVDEPNYKYNRDWGYLDNEQNATKVNFGHKPLGIFQWDINFTDKTQLSAKLYGSKGTSGSTDFSGGILGSSAQDITDVNGQIDLTFISQYNSDTLDPDPTSVYNRDPNYIDGNGNEFYINSPYAGAYIDSNDNTVYTYDSGITLLSEITNQTFYGGILNLSTQLTDNFKLNYGLDARKTVYNKTRIVNNLFGADGYDLDFSSTPSYSLNTNNTALPEPLFDFTKKNLGATPVDYKYDAKIAYLGSYAQIEYDIWKLNFLAQGGFNRQFIQRVNYSLGNYAESNPGSGVYDIDNNTSESTSELSIDGYNAKFGVNFNVTAKHNLWANAGFVSRPPVFVTVFSGLNNDINPNYKNEKFKSIEIGYGFRSRSISLNISAYSSDHKDAETPYYSPEQGNFGTTSGINRVNRGVELDVTAAPMRRLILKGTLSLGDWKYSSNATFYDLLPGSTTPVSTLYIKDHKIGGAPQLMASMSASYEFFKNFNLGTNLKYSDKMYASPSLERYDPNFIVYKENATFFKNPILLPDFTVVDAFASYRFRINVVNYIDLRLNVDNIFNRKYISESNSSYEVDSPDPTTFDVATLSGPSFRDNGNVYRGLAGGNNAFFGLGRTWNFTVRYEF